MALVVKGYSERAVEGEKKMVGFYGLKRRYHGEQFELEKESDFSARWMKWVKGPLSQDEEREEQADAKKKGSRHETPRTKDAS